MVTTLSFLLGLYLIIESLSALNEAKRIKLKDWLVAVSDIYTMKYWGTLGTGAWLLFYCNRVTLIGVLLGLVIALWVVPRTLHRYENSHRVRQIKEWIQKT